VKPVLTKVDENLWIIDTMALGRSGVVAAYLIRGKESALIDMGYASSVSTVLRDIEQTGIGPNGLGHLLPTHVHLDHAGACGALAETFPHAYVRVHPKGERHLVDPSKLWKGAAELFGNDLMVHYGMPRPISADRVKSIDDGESIGLGSGVTLRAIWTPGHASHHLSYVLEGRGTIFTGDAVGITYPAVPLLIPTTPPTSFNLPAAVKSLQRIREASPSRLLTPHYGVIDNPIESIDANIRSLPDWTEKIKAMSLNKFQVDEIIARITEDISRRAGKTSLPDYAQGSIRISVLGVIRYLEFISYSATGRR
jgi:glyoxylase-like metal-dependent hydrolase (beta-lactamase superfamily II)